MEASFNQINQEESPKEILLSLSHYSKHRSF